MCDSSVKEYFLTAIPEASRRNIQPCVGGGIKRCFKLVSSDLKKYVFSGNLDRPHA